MKKNKNVYLRPLEAHDFENWRQAYSSLRAPQNEWDEGPWKDSELTLSKFKKMLKAQKELSKKDQFYTYGVFRHDDGVLVGYVTLMDISRTIFQNAYLGYRIFNNYWGQGYATEACQQVLRLAFRELKLHRVEAGIEPHNKISLRVAKAIGLRKEGLSRRRLWVRGQWKDMVLFAATCEDFRIKYKVALQS